MGLLSKKKQQAAAAPGASDAQLPSDVQMAARSEAALGTAVDAEGNQAPARSAKSAPAASLDALPQIDTLTPEQRRTLHHVQALSKVMDSAINIPIINKRFGLDAMIGLVPWAGDIAGATVGGYIISRALKYNMPKRLVMRMMINQGIDSVVGLVPFIGDLFDFAFKANHRNMKLLMDHLDHPKQATRADTCFLITLFLLVVVLPVVLFMGIVAAIVVAILAAFNKL